MPKCWRTFPRGLFRSRFASVCWDSGLGGILQAKLSEGGFQQSGHHSAGPLQGSVRWEQEHHQSRKWWVRFANGRVIRKRRRDSWKRHHTRTLMRVRRVCFALFQSPVADGDDKECFRNTEITFSLYLFVILFILIYFTCLQKTRGKGHRMS